MITVSYVEYIILQHRIVLLRTFNEMFYATSRNKQFYLLFEFDCLLVFSIRSIVEAFH